LDANAAVVSSGPVIINAFNCTGCAVLTSDPFSPPVLAATGLFGSSVSGTALFSGELIEIPIVPPPPPPQVLPPAQPPASAPPADTQQTTETTSTDGTETGSTQKDDGSTRKRRVPRCG
jgi:hypothetical protein